VLYWEGSVEVDNSLSALLDSFLLDYSLIIEAMAFVNQFDFPDRRNLFLNTACLWAVFAPVMRLISIIGCSRYLNSSELLVPINTKYTVMIIAPESVIDKDVEQLVQIVESMKLPKSYLKESKTVRGKTTSKPTPQYVLSFVEVYGFLDVEYLINEKLFNCKYSVYPSGPITASLANSLIFFLTENLPLAK